MLRRLPVVPIATGLWPVWSRADALFASWFGPVGVAAVFYATLPVQYTGSRRVWHVCSLVVVASILAYGLTATPLTKRYGARVGSDAASDAG